MKIVVWDAPVRLFHWALALLVVFSFVTGQLGGSWLEWHMRSGYAILALLLFRLLWGFAGSETARFAHFLRGPAAGLAYARETLARRKASSIGHNPLGGWMVMAMLAILLVQAVSGLFVDDEIATQGPLAVKVSNAFVARMGTLHHYNQWLVLGAVVLHVGAIVAYHRLLAARLVPPMVTGSLDVPEGTRQPRLRPAWLAAVLLAASAAATYWLVVVYPAAKAAA